MNRYLLPAFLFLGVSLFWAAAAGDLAAQTAPVKPPQPGPLLASAYGARGSELPVPQAAKPCRRFAVCIGINGYQKEGGYPPLEFAGADAVEVAATLLRDCRFDRVLLMTDGDVKGRFDEPSAAGRITIVNDVSYAAISKHPQEFFEQADGPDDVVFFYFAGHGDLKKRAALIARDFHIQNAKGRYFWIDELFRWFSDPCQAGSQLLVFDACRANPAGRHSMSEEFLKELGEDGQDLTVISACAQDESAWEDSQLGHGRFTSAFVQGLAGRAFAPGEQRMTYQHVYQYVVDQFPPENRPKQTPRLFDATGTPFVFRRRSAEEAIPKLQKLALEDARAAYRRADLAASDELYLRAIESQRENLSTDDARRLLGRLLAERARVLYRLGEPTAAELKSVRAEAAKLSPDAPDLDEIRGSELLVAKKYPEAAAAFAAAEAGYGGSAGVTAHLLSDYGVALYHTREYQRAFELFNRAAEESIRLKRLKDAASHLRYAAKCRQAVGATSEADNFLERASKLLLESKEASQPGYGHRAAAFLEDLSLLSAAAGDAAGGLARAQQAHAIRIALKDTDRPEFARGCRTLAAMYELNGNLQAAGDHLAMADAFYEKTYGEYHPDGAAIRILLAGLNERLLGGLRNVAQSTEKVRRRALLIGIQDYADAPLKYAHKDMAEFRDNLRGWGYEEPVFLNDKDFGSSSSKYPSRRNIIEALSRFLDEPPPPGKDDLVLIAFSGYGTHDGKKSYLLPIGATGSDLSTWISVEDDIFPKLKDSRSKQRILLFDACRSSFSRSSENADDLPPGILKANTLSSLNGEKFAADIAGFVAPQSPDDTVVFSSCGINQYSFESATLQSGVFMHFVNDALKGGEAKESRDQITIFDLFEHSSVGVAKYLRARQQPEISVAGNSHVPFGVDRGLDFSGRDLTKLSRSELLTLRLRKGRFDRANMEGMDLSGLDFSSASFKGARLTGANFSNANLSKCVFVDADCAIANFEGASMIGVKAQNARFDNAILPSKSIQVTGMQAQGASFTGATGSLPQH